MSLLVVTIAGIAVSIAVSVHAGDVVGAGEDLRVAWLDALLMVVPFGVAGAVLLDRRGDLPFGWLLGVAACSLTVSLVVVAPATFAVLDGDRSPGARWAVALGAGLWFVPEAVKGLVNLRFPSGAITSRWGRALQWAIVGGTVLTLLGAAFGESALETSPDDPRATQLPPLEHPLTGGSALGELADGLLVFAPVTVLLGLFAGIGVIVRWRRAAGIERQQLTWRVVGVVLGVALFPVAVTSGTGAYARLDVPFFVLTLAVPVLRYRLWAIETIVRRSIVYASVLGVLLALYAATTAALAGLAPDRIGAFVAAAAVAVAFLPLRDVIGRFVEHRFFGARNDPQRALGELSARLTVVNPRDVASTTVETVARSMRLPYTAIERTDGRVVASSGAATGRAERWPLVFEGVTIGQLVAAPRSGEDALDARDRQLLASAARQAGMAVHAASLTTDLLASRERLVMAREEERRRLRRDLHDDLGPILTAIGLDLDAARTQLGGSCSADELLAEARQATTQAIGELRRVIDGLRPPALDDLGLAGALSAHAARLQRSGAVDTVIEVDRLPELPAALEVAAFRTATEALHNAVRHGGARHCVIRLRLDGPRLVLDVRDDGRADASWRPGVGLTTMGERADELGGTFSAGPHPGGGFEICAAFPLTGGPP